MPEAPEAPGLSKPRRFVPRFHWELLACGMRGHMLVGTDAAAIRPEDSVVVREHDGKRWHRCVRCDSWLPLDAPAAPTRDTPPGRDEIELPLRGRALRDTIVLRAIAINRLVHFLVLGLLSAAIFLFSANRSTLRDTFYRVLADLEGGVAHGHAKHGLVHDLDHVFSLQSSTLHLVGVVVGVYAFVEGVEAIGLWLLKRWAEYLTFAVTTSLLPLELYELSERLSPLKLLTLIVNLAVCAYLLFAKRLFGLRGGAAAEHAQRTADTGWTALERTAPGAPVIS